jgi:hypothetical protein
MAVWAKTTVQIPSPAKIERLFPAAAYNRLAYSAAMHDMIFAEI